MLAWKGDASFEDLDITRKISEERITNEKPNDLEFCVKNSRFINTSVPPSRCFYL